MAHERQHAGVSTTSRAEYLEVNSEMDQAAREPSEERVSEIAFEAAKQRLGLGMSPGYVGALMLTNTLLGGTGMLGIPHALSVSGYLLGIFFVFVFGSVSAFGCHLLHCTARKLGRAPCSFYSVTQAVAPRWVWLIDSAVMVKCFGVATSYLIIAGDLAPGALQYFGASRVPRWQGISLGFAVAGPLACARNLSALRYTAVASLLVVAWTASMLLLFFIRAGPGFEPCTVNLDDVDVLDIDNMKEFRISTLPCNEAGYEAFARDPYALVKVLPVFVFGFTCHQNIFTICNEVGQATGKRLDRIIMISYMIGGGAFGSVALLGYATYGDQVTSNVLKRYPKTDLVELTYLLLSFLVVASYPLQAHPSRASALTLLNSVCGTSVEDVDKNKAGHERCLFYAVTVVWLVASYLLALSVDELGKILALVGASGSMAVSYILPGLVYTRTFPRGTWKWIMAKALLLGGSILAPVCFVAICL